MGLAPLTPPSLRLTSPCLSNHVISFWCLLLTIPFLCPPKIRGAWVDCPRRLQPSWHPPSLTTKLHHRFLLLFPSVPAKPQELPTVAPPQSPSSPTFWSCLPEEEPGLLLLVPSMQMIWSMDQLQPWLTMQSTYSFQAWSESPGLYGPASPGWECIRNR